MPYTGISGKRKKTGRKKKRRSFSHPLGRERIDWLRGVNMQQTLFPSAMAVLRGGEAFPQIRGTVKIYQRQGGTLIDGEIAGLPASDTGFFAFHIHEGDDCSGKGFSDTAGHFNPDSADHPHHAGDLPPLLSVGGRARMQVLTGRFSVEEVIGKTVVIHAEPDDFHTQPSGGGGEKSPAGLSNGYNMKSPGSGVRSVSRRSIEKISELLLIYRSDRPTGWDISQGFS